MWNDPGWGGYLLWALGPDHKVFIDGRLDFYEHAGVLSDFIHIVKLEPDVLFMMRKYGIKSCLTAPGTPLDTFLAAQRDWQRRLHDGGWLTLAWPKDLGGRGATPIMQAIYEEEMARVGAPPPHSPPRSGRTPAR